METEAQLQETERAGGVKSRRYVPRETMKNDVDDVV